jgi:hypothetical protein
VRRLHPVPAVLLLCCAPACSREDPPAKPAGPPDIPAATIPPDRIAETLDAAREARDGLEWTDEIRLIERRFRRMNLVAMGRHPDDGRPIYTTKNESPEFRRMALAMRSSLGDGPVDALGEVIIERGLAALIDERGTFRTPMTGDSFGAERIPPEALEMMAWTRDLPMLLLHREFVAPDNRSTLPSFTLRTLLHARWNLESGRPAEHRFTDAERIAWYEFRGRHRTWAPRLERKEALEALAALLPGYPLDDALEALASTPDPRARHPAGGPLVVEETP